MIDATGKAKHLDVCYPLNGRVVYVVSYHDVVICVKSNMMVARIVSDKQIIAEGKLFGIYKVIGS